jgi:DNA-binding XRE family transcriptional regulator
MELEMLGIDTARHHGPSFELDRTLRVERAAFAAKIRAARAVLGLSQDQFAHQIGLTQKSVHRIEQRLVQPQLRTILKIEQFWRHQGISFENLRTGGFRLVVESSVLLRD